MTGRMGRSGSPGLHVGLKSLIYYERAVSFYHLLFDMIQFMWAIL